MSRQERAFTKLDDLESRSRVRGPLTVAIAYPCSDEAFAAALSAQEAGLIEPIFVGPRARMALCAEAASRDLTDLRVVETEDDAHAASKMACSLAASGDVDALMKGSQHTHDLLSAVLSPEFNLRTSRRMSHVFWFDLPQYPKPLMLTDAVINVTPGLPEKIDILHNVIKFAVSLGVGEPKIALLSAVETVSPALQSSLDAALLCKMAERGQIKGAIIDGPLAFDNAISRHAAAVKGIVSPVAGDPDILMAPTLDAANILYKSLVYMGGGECAGIVLGARVPIIVTSRADSARARSASCALARLSCAT